ncbi:uncharacterized protein CANTADRAFT_39796, partial [Suhomyces tanzawaensis NRRL Y-17324]
RFFNTVDYTNYERKAILHRLSRAWLRYANSVGIQTWLAHGTLLGWFWNGLNLPWDLDLDVQITTTSLLLLARNYNQTLVLDVTDNDINLGVATYLVDVGPAYHHRSRGNGLNTIDARFIDTSTGFYVDITALSHTEKQLRMEMESLRAKYIENQELFSCKNLHFSTWDNLSPLRQTLFEGVKAYVPNAFQHILKREYHHGLYSKQHEKHTYRPVLDLWVPSHICRNDPIGNACHDADTLLDADHTKQFTTYHRQEMAKIKIENGDFDTFRID